MRDVKLILIILFFLSLSAVSSAQEQSQPIWQIYYREPALFMYFNPIDNIYNLSDIEFTTANANESVIPLDFGEIFDDGESIVSVPICFTIFLIGEEPGGNPLDACDELTSDRQFRKAITLDAIVWLNDFEQLRGQIAIITSDGRSQNCIGTTICTLDEIVPLRFSTETDITISHIWQLYYRETSIWIYFDPGDGVFDLSNIDFSNFDEEDISLEFNELFDDGEGIIDEPKCFVIYVTGEDPGTSPFDECEDESDIVSPSDRFPEDVMIDEAIWLDEFERIRNQILVSNDTGALQICVATTICNITAIPPKIYDPIPSGMVAVVIADSSFFIDEDVILGNDWIINGGRAYSVILNWHPRVQAGEVDQFGFSYLSLLEPNYLPSFADQVPTDPLVDSRLNWFVADMYCRSLGYRLPTLTELEVAQGVMPNGFRVRERIIEWTGTPYIGGDQSPDENPLFYELWVKASNVVAELLNWQIRDGTGYIYPVFTDTQTIEMGFRCASDVKFNE